jgi:hypothetical protein
VFQIDDAPGVAIRRRPQQDRVDQREDDDVRADAQGSVRIAVRVKG